MGTSWVGIEQKPARSQKAFSTNSSSVSGIAQQSNSFSFSKKPSSRSGKRNLITAALIFVGILIGLLSDTDHRNSDLDMRQLVTVPNWPPRQGGPIVRQSACDRAGDRSGAGE